MNPILPPKLIQATTSTEPIRVVTLNTPLSPGLNINDIDYDSESSTYSSSSSSSDYNTNSAASSSSDSSDWDSPTGYDSCEYTKHKRSISAVSCLSIGSTYLPRLVQKENKKLEISSFSSLHSSKSIKSTGTDEDARDNNNMNNIYYQDTLFYPHPNLQSLVFSNAHPYTIRDYKSIKNYHNDNENDNDYSENTDKNTKIMDWSNIESVNKIRELISKLLITASLQFGIREDEIYLMFSTPSPSDIIQQMRFGLLSDLCDIHIDLFGRRSYYYHSVDTASDNGDNGDFIGDIDIGMYYHSEFPSHFNDLILNDNYLSQFVCDTPVDTSTKTPVSDPITIPHNITSFPVITNIITKHPGADNKSISHFLGRKIIKPKLNINSNYYSHKPLPKTKAKVRINTNTTMAKMKYVIRPKYKPVPIIKISKSSSASISTSTSTSFSSNSSSFSTSKISKKQKHKKKNAKKNKPLPPIPDKNNSKKNKKKKKKNKNKKKLKSKSKPLPPNPNQNPYPNPNKSDHKNVFKFDNYKIKNGYKKDKKDKKKKKKKVRLKSVKHPDYFNRKKNKPLPPTKQQRRGRAQTGAVISTSPIPKPKAKVDLQKRKSHIIQPTTNNMLKFRYFSKPNVQKTNDNNNISVMTLIEFNSVSLLKIIGDLNTDSLDNYMNLNLNYEIGRRIALYFDKSFGDTDTVVMVSGNNMHPALSYWMEKGYLRKEKHVGIYDKTIWIYRTIPHCAPKLPIVQQNEFIKYVQNISIEMKNESVNLIGDKLDKKFGFGCHYARSSGKRSDYDIYCRFSNKYECSFKLQSGCYIIAWRR